LIGRAAAAVDDRAAVALALTALSRAVGGVLRGARIGRAVGVDRPVHSAVGERHVEIAEDDAAPYRTRHGDGREQEPQGDFENAHGGHPLIGRAKAFCVAQRGSTLHAGFGPFRCH
jgi:hypothetical protein